MILKILRNSVFLLAGQVTAKALALAGMILIARKLGVEGLGLYGTVMAYLTLLATVADAGMGTVTIRDVARDYARSHAYFRHVLILRAGLTFTVYAGVVTVIGLWPSSPYPLAFAAVCGLFLFPEAFRKLGISMLSAYERMDLVAILDACSTIFRYLPFFLAIAWGKSVPTAFLFLVAAWIIVAGIWLAVVQRVCLRSDPLPTGSFDFQRAWTILHDAYPFGILAILAIIYFKVDIVMLSQMQGHEAVGFYEGAYKFIEAAMFIPVSIVNVLLPVMSRSFATDQNSYKTVYIHATRLLALGVLPIVILVTFFAKEIILLVLTDAYLPSVPALAVLIWALFLIFVNAPVGNILATSRSIHAFLPYAIANTLFNVGLNWVLIPRYSFLGASVATVLSEILAFAIQLYFAHRIMGNAAAMLTILGKILVVGAGAGLILYGVRPYLALPFAALVFLGSYGGGLLLIRVVQPEDLELLRTLQEMIRSKIRRISE